MNQKLRRLIPGILLGIFTIGLAGCDVDVYDAHGYHHHGYYDNDHVWHGGYYDEDHHYHDDPGDWHH